MTNRSTRLQALLSLKLGRPVADVIAEHRADGLSLRSIAQALTDATGEPVSHETVATWVRATESVA